jgi:hypothetical protein
VVAHHAAAVAPTDIQEARGQLHSFGMRAGEDGQFLKRYDTTSRVIP